MRYPNTLQVERKRQKLTQHELAVAIGGITQTQISNLETGVSVPTLEQLRNIKSGLTRAMPRKGPKARRVV